ncbi:urease accessory protein D isoform X1 [Actinidia eriantha]|uniref:urease accessory protein D isoform X1 n=1 Tax=Actinidia eriantha TaxID=165200 RepID=UPI00258326A5|nr:urease accessory protein D isoform X1 [Actinidia eriantha]XP_057510282.1 urease accessory protein D isoform X1 [Actinidia eriantha]XP_057510283.1 urease accessory protein D isoform X1 [Actinidia eriantha]XP_057510285.1 urease accessory protein D isoform X1 [Actinidia eriantha]XP_057510286.1 urease accessory protein D isoform X1 [Actinidia eriantha]XP_057510287.1 urease accessory protein D isoform X1 [Actinidia eriantha]
METGKIVVEIIGGKSTVTRCFSKYPLKFIIPTKVGSSQTDAVWIYSLTYGGGIVSGDSISCDLTIGDGCTTVLTTQASTKVYKSVQSKCSEQVLEARIGSGALLAVVPDPVTCFSTAKYIQKQVFTVASDSNLLIVDWITSGRHESGERWDFALYKSTNHIFLEDNQPLFLDATFLEQGTTTIAERMQDYQVLAMVVLLGPKLQHVQNQVQQHVKTMMSEQLHRPFVGRYGKTNADHCLMKPAFIASCSVFGPKGVGVVVRIAAMTTESVYRFLQHQLVSLEPLLGVSPYRSS